MVMLIGSTGSFFRGGREKVLQDFSTDMVLLIPISACITEGIRLCYRGIVMGAVVGRAVTPVAWGGILSFGLFTDGSLAGGWEDMAKGVGRVSYGMRTAAPLVGSFTPHLRDTCLYVDFSVVFGPPLQLSVLPVSGDF